MDYFWIIPVAIAIFVVLWGFYAYIRRHATERQDGTVLTDEPRHERRI